MYKKGLVLLLFVALSSLAIAQNTIKGFVYDNDSGEPIPFANVVLKGTNYGVATDINGFFSINKIPDGKYTLTLRYVGFEEYAEEITLSGKQVVSRKINLKVASQQLKEVKIKGNREERKIETTVSVEKISPKQIQQLPSIGGQADLAQYLQVLPGVTFTGDQGGQLYIRGGSMIQNKTLLDGMAVYNPFHSIGLFSVFETDVILSADIYTGGFGAEYGGRLSSIMDITTRDGNKRHHTGKIGITTLGANLILEGPLKKETPESKSTITYLVTAKNSYLSQSSGLFYSYMDSGLPYDFMDLYGKLTMQSENGSKVSLFGFNYTDEVKNYQSIANYDWYNYGGGANFSAVTGSNAIMEGNFAYSDYKITLEDESNYPKSSRINGFTFGLHMTYFIGKNKLKYGVDLEGFGTNYEFYNSFGRYFKQTENTSEMSAFVTYNIKAGKWLIDPGFRLIYYASVAEVSPEPRLAIKYNATDKLRFKLASGLYSQNFLDAKSDNDVVNLFTGFLTGSENLGVSSTFGGEEVTSFIQKAQHIILGVEYDINDYLQLNIEPYFKNFSQLINMNRNKMFDNLPEYQEGGAYETPEYLRTDFIIEKGKAYGVDFSLKYSYDKIYLWVAYSLGYIERTSEAEGAYNPHYDRRHNINTLATYTAGDSREWEFSARWNFGSGFPYTMTRGIYELLPFYDINTDYGTGNGEIGIYYSALNQGRLPYYHRFDISAKRKFSLGRRSILEVNASITNVYNRENMFYFNRLTFERVDQMPIMPSLGMTLTF
ncbi:MAG: carboxypeptidase-like regulatory domain-containing protein [Bacteroidales bacterium]|nr:carboxypeptidase-like regulatory domain-containing protein [Bacteroidales bacterium]